MENELQKKKRGEQGKNKPVGLIVFSSLAVILLFIGELYVMIAMEGALLEIVLVGVAVLVFAYLDLSSVVKWIRINEEEREEQYAGMLKAEKASYLLIRKYFDEIEEQLALMEDKISDPYQEIIAAQKATAKVTINRSKENADALMNSNDKLLDIIFGMESKIEEMASIVSGSLSDVPKETGTEVVQKQIEMSNQMREMELNLKNEIFQAVSKLSNISPQVVMQPQMMPAQQMAAPAQPEPLGDLELGGLGDLGDFATLDADITAGPEDLGLEPELAPMEELMPELTPIEEAEQELPPMEELAPELAPIEEAEPELAPMEEAAPELAPIEEAEPELMPIAEPEAKELPPMPDLSDPDRELSLDELDGLLANIAAEEAALGAEPAPEPEVKELPPMPDLSDPNRSMSPDEIAALFANLG